jgi:site-specific DNA recombinase
MALNNGIDKTRAVGYCRVSTAAQVRTKDEGEKESLPVQRRMIEGCAISKGWELAAIFEDAGITGKKDDRPGLQTLLNAARRKEFDAVIVKDLSRFGRSARDLQNNVQILWDRGVTFVSLKENMVLDNTDPYSKFLFQILASVAELEHNMIFERMRDGKMSKWRDKRMFNGSPPIGYAWNKQTHTIEVVPEEAAVYQRIVTEYLDLGKSIRDIAVGLQKDAVPTRLGGKWSVTAICQFLRNPAYYGIITATAKQRNGNGEVIFSEDIIFDAPPLITKSRWDELQDRLASARQQRSGRPIFGAQQFLLYGMLKCGECGAKVIPRWGAPRVDGSRPRYYACHWRGCGTNHRELAGRDKCTLPMIPAEKLEGFIFMNHLMMRLGLNKEAYYVPALDPAKWEKKIESARKKHEQLQESLRRKNTALKNIDSLLEDPDFDKNTFGAKRNAILADIPVLSLEIEEAVAEIERLHQLREQEDLLAKFARDKQGVLKDAHKKIATLPDEGKQRLLRGMLAGPIVIKRPSPEAQLDDGPLMEWLDFSFRFNPAILKEFLDDGTGTENRQSAHNGYGGDAPQKRGCGPRSGAFAGCALLAAVASL